MGGMTHAFPLPVAPCFLLQFLVADYCPHFPEGETEAQRKVVSGLVRAELVRAELGGQPRPLFWS